MWACGAAHYSERQYDSSNLLLDQTSRVIPDLISYFRLQPLVIPFLLTSGCSLRHTIRYNAIPHTAWPLETILEMKKKQRMMWPTFSSGLNHIEHVWNTHGRHIAIKPILSWLYRTWRLHFLNNGTEFPKTSQKPRKTRMNSLTSSHSWEPYIMSQILHRIKKKEFFFHLQVLESFQIFKFL